MSGCGGLATMSANLFLLITQARKDYPCTFRSNDIYLSLLTCPRNALYIVQRTVDRVESLLLMCGDREKPRSYWHSLTYEKTWCCLLRYQRGKTVPGANGHEWLNAIDSNIQRLEMLCESIKGYNSKVECSESTNFFGGKNIWPWK